ncbi:MAG: chloride channel protein [Chthonomonadales bacterium]|nr:chloride channel protein [Chthonomonadales bacterium]
MDQIEDRLADFTTDRRVLILSAAAVVIGVIGAAVAYSLVWLIAVMTNLAYYHRLSSASVSPAGSPLGYAAVLVPVVGGLIVGLMARYGSDKIRGHGIPEALEAILIGRSRIGPKVAILKPLSSAISIGTGGPFGAEGPIIMTGGAFGSLLAQFVHLSSAERKTLLVAGASAGMAAVFGTPVAAVLLAVELLLFEWKPRSFIPVAIAAATAAALRVPLLGAGPLFPVGPHAPLGVHGLVIAGVVGVLAGLGSGALTNLVYGFEDLFPKLPIHWMWWPAIGGLFVGLGGLIDPRVLGVGYETIHALLRNQVVGVALLGILIGKSLVWSIALGSGTSGGVLAPLLMMGAALGALEARYLPIGSPGLWAMVSMAAMMGGTMRSPFTAVVFTLELTHDLNVVPALLVGCIASEAVSVLLLRRSILTEKVARHGHHITREYAMDPFDICRVGEAMESNPTPLRADMRLADLAAGAAGGYQAMARVHAAPIVDGAGRLVGVITQSDILRALEEPDGDCTTVLEAGTPDPVVAYPDELMRDAVKRMLRHQIGRLPVVSRENPRQLVGFLERRNVMAARQGWYEEEYVRERVWKARRPRSRTDGSSPIA